MSGLRDSAIHAASLACEVKVPQGVITSAIFRNILLLGDEGNQTELFLELLGAKGFGQCPCIGKRSKGFRACGNKGKRDILLCTPIGWWCGAKSMTSSYKRRNEHKYFAKDNGSLFQPTRRSVGRHVEERR